MARFKVALVFKDPPVPSWVPGRLEEAGIEFVERDCKDRDDLARCACDADIVWSCGGCDLLKGDNLKVLEKCGAVLRSGAGTDEVDVQRLTELGIILANTPHAVVDPVADHTISLLFSLVRQVTRHDRLVRGGRWQSTLAPPNRQFQRATMGFVGFGRIPRLIVQKLIGFRMDFIAYDPFVSAGEMDALSVKCVTLEEVFRTADYVSAHCPLVESTHHLIGEAQFQLMQPHSMFINTSRGKVVDEPALVKALEEGRIAGAALDVLEQEPPDPGNPLLAMDNVIITPHSAGHSYAWPEAFYVASVEAIIDFSQQRWPRSVVNPEVKPRWSHLAPPKHT